jgi:hypothetical protein
MLGRQVIMCLRPIDLTKRRDSEIPKYWFDCQLKLRDTDARDLTSATEHDWSLHERRDIADCEWRIWRDSVISRQNELY